METTTHPRPNYIAIWGLLAFLTAVEVGVAFFSGIPKLFLMLALIFLAVYKALLVAMYFMHLKFEPRKLVILVCVPLPLAAILVLAVITEKIW